MPHRPVVVCVLCAIQKIVLLKCTDCKGNLSVLSSQFFLSKEVFFKELG